MRSRSAVRVSLEKDAHTVNAEPLRRVLIILTRVSDPYTFDMDPDPGFL
jgi:hypothetical protein